MKIVFATKNQGKLKEIRAILKDLKIEVLSSDAAGVTKEIIEDKKTLKENALKKARLVAKATGFFALADDSGIFIKKLNGAPGIKSARWAGENAKDSDLVKLTLKKLNKVPANQRQAYFATIAALAAPTGQTRTFTGKVFGTISLAPKGRPRKKLPYDLIFIPQGYKKTFAEMTNQQKNSLSHRGIAFKKLKKFLMSKKCVQQFTGK